MSNIGGCVAHWKALRVSAEVYAALVSLNLQFNPYLVKLFLLPLSFYYYATISMINKDYQ